MSFNKKTICILMVLIMAAALAACTGQTTVPTATVAPTVEEPTAVPTTETVEEKTDESASVAADSETAAADEEKPAEETAVEETAEDTAAAETSEEKPAETEVKSEETEENPAAEDITEVTAETVEESTETAPTEEAKAETEETAITEDSSAEAVEENKTTAETQETTVTEETTSEATAVEETAETTESAADEKAEAATAAETEETADADSQFAATVDGEGVSLEDFEQMAVFNRYQYLNQYAQYAQMYSMYGLPLDSLDEQVEGILGENGKERLGSEVIDQLTYDKVLQFEAEKEGLELTDEDIYNQLKTMLGYEEPAAVEEGPMGMTSFNVEPAATESESDKYADLQKYAESVLSQGYGGAVSFNFIKNYARNILLDNRMFEANLEDRVFEAEMVNARHILVEDEETAKDILARLEAGEEWDDLASENSLDTANKDNSGSLGWFGRGEMVAEFEQAAFALEPGEISKPVQTSYGYHIIASDGKEVRPLSGAALQAAQSEAYDEWTLEMRAKHDIQSYPEVWLDAVPMEPAFVSLNPAPATDETTADAEAETVNTDEAEAVATVVETVEEASAEAEEAEAVAAAAETVEEASAKAEAAEAVAAVAETVEEASAEAEAAAAVAAAAETVEEASAEAEAAETIAAAAETVEEASAEAEAAAAVAAVAETVEEASAEAEAAEAVAVINGIDITADEFVQEAIFNRYQVLSSYQQYVQYASMFGISMDEVNSYYENLLGESGKEEFGNQTLEQLYYAKMLDFESDEMDIMVSRKDAENQMKQMFGYEDAENEAEASLGLESFNLDDELTDADAEDLDFRAFMESDISEAFNNKISYDFYLDYIRHSLIERAIIDKLFEEKAPEPKQEEQVNARHILVEDEETAKEIIAKLEAGEDWNALAAEYSLDTGNKDYGGSLGWFGRDVMVDEFEEAAFDLEPGEISDPVKSDFGWHIIASDGKEMRPVDDEAAVRDELFNEWYEGLAEKYQRESYPEKWLPLVPEEPVFTPIKVEAPAEDSNAPTFHIISDENGTVTDEEVAVETKDNGEVELTIENTEQTVIASAEGEKEDEAESNSNTEQTVNSPAESEKEDEEEITIDNTEQVVEAYTINNDAENNDQPEAKPTEVNADAETAEKDDALLLNNNGENK